MDDRDFADMEIEGCNRLFDDMAECEHEDGDGYCNSPDPAATKLLIRAEAAESALSAERKETERLRELLRDAFDPMQHFVACQKRLMDKCMCHECIKERSKAALQERQGEEQVCEWDGNVAGCGGWQQYQFCPYCRKPLVIKEEAQ